MVGPNHHSTIFITLSLLLQLLYRAAAQEKLSADDLLAELKSSMEWSEGAMAVVRHVWKEEGPALISMPQETLSVGQVGGCGCERM